MRTALAVGAASVATIACSTSDQVLAWEEIPHAGDAGMPDTGRKPAADCGNGIREEGEACDDGNLSNGDGCSALCTIEPPAPPSACPGTVFPLSAVDATTRVGSVTGDTSEHGLALQSPTCGGATGKDVVYAITSDVEGVARIRLEASFDALLYIRTACGDASTEVACKRGPAGSGKTEVVLPMANGQTVYVVVDGATGKSGTFQLGVEIGPTSCGDGIAQFPEQCDDGNLIDGDGCNAACRLETPMAAPGTCPGASYMFVGSATGPKKLSFAGDVSTLANTMGSLGCGGGLGPDQVYAITPTISGAITAELHASYPAALLHVRGECSTSSTELDCKQGPVAGVPMRTTFPVEAQKTYFVFADTDTLASNMAPGGGIYRLDVTLAPATCANGVLESPEQCDDGNMVDGDGCSASCTLEPAPAGIDSCPGAPITLVPGTGNAMTFRHTASTVALNPGVKSCSNPTASTNNGAVYTFVAPFDGWFTGKVSGSFNVSLNLRSECMAEGEPDRGPSVETAPSIACADAEGGNDAETVAGPIAFGTPYWIVVEGGKSNANTNGVYTLEIEMKPSVCGNGVTEGGEECDDGANDPGDQCAPDCSLEPVPSTRTTCANAEPLALVEGAPGTYGASVKGGNWNFPGGGFFAAPCAGEGREAYFTITPPISGVVVARVDAASYDVSIGVRPACPPNTGADFLACSNRSAGPGSERFAFAATAGTTYWIIVDAPGTKDLGRFQLDVELKEDSCGDGLVSGTEQCDDGNLTDGDGCSAACQLEALAGTDTCPGHAIALMGVGTATRERVVTVSTTDLASDYSATCGGSGRDAVVAVTSDIAGTMTAQLTATWPTIFYARTTCSSASSEIDCKANDPTKLHLRTTEIVTPVQPNVPVYLFIDGTQGGAGPATLSVTVTP